MVFINLSHHTCSSVHFDSVMGHLYQKQFRGSMACFGLYFQGTSHHWKCQGTISSKIIKHGGTQLGGLLSHVCLAYFRVCFCFFFWFCRPWLSAQEIVLLTMDSSSLQLIINNQDSLMQTCSQAKLTRTNFYLNNHAQITLGIVKLTNNAN